VPGLVLKNYPKPIKYLWSFVLVTCGILFAPTDFIAPFAISTVSASTLASTGYLAPVSDPHPPDWIPWEGQDDIERLQYPQNQAPPVLLPDLRTLPPSDLSLVINSSERQKLIRFSNTIWNRGPGVLELFGEFNPQNDTVRVTQNIHAEDRSVLEHEAGEFEFHASHGHWHWEGFSLYEVWTVGEDGSLQQLLASSDKVGYCVRDIAPQSEQLIDESSTSNRGYNSCFWARQGLSVGWNDTYRAHIPGQIVDITSLPDGLYGLKSTVDPENIIVESEDGNNSAALYFSLYQDQITIFGDSSKLIRMRSQFD
jgi:hypothetical protein